MYNDCIGLMRFRLIKKGTFLQYIHYSNEESLLLLKGSPLNKEQYDFPIILK